MILEDSVNDRLGLITILIISPQATQFATRIYNDSSQYQITCSCMVSSILNRRLLNLSPYIFTQTFNSSIIIWYGHMSYHNVIREHRPYSRGFKLLNSWRVFFLPPWVCSTLIYIIWDYTRMSWLGS